MATHLLSSWEIMPQAITVCTGDVHIDGTIVAGLVLAWVIRTKSLGGCSGFVPGGLWRFLIRRHALLPRLFPNSPFCSAARQAAMRRTDSRESSAGIEVKREIRLEAPACSSASSQAGPRRFDPLNNSPLKREGFDQIKTLLACGCPQTCRHPDHETLSDAVLVRSRVLRRAAGIA